MLFFNVFFGVILCLLTFFFFKDIHAHDTEAIRSITFTQILLILTGICIIIRGDATLYYFTAIMTAMMFNFYVAVAVGIRGGRRIIIESILALIFLAISYLITDSLLQSASLFGLAFPLFIILGFWRVTYQSKKVAIIDASILISSFVILSLSLVYSVPLGYIFYISSTILSIVTIVLLYRKKDQSFKENIDTSSDDRVTKAREINRKIFHLVFATSIGLPFLGIFMPYDLIRNMTVGILYLFTQKNLIIKGLRMLIIILGGSLLIVVMFFEKMRLMKNFSIYPSDLLRDFEFENIATYVYFLVSTFFIAVLYNEFILITSIIVSLIADAFSALVGMKIGKTIITENRTLEGTLAGMLSALFLLWVFTGDVIVSFVASLLLATLDVLHQYLKVDDNLLFPNAIALILFLMW